MRLGLMGIFSLKGQSVYMEKVSKVDVRECHISLGGIKTVQRDCT